MMVSFGAMPLHKVLLALHLMVLSKKGVSAPQLARVLKVRDQARLVLRAPYP
jgi:hypothetical protein